jgi:hypothetical protein
MLNLSMSYTRGERQLIYVLTRLALDPAFDNLDLVASGILGIHRELNKLLARLPTR